MEGKVAEMNEHLRQHMLETQCEVCGKPATVFCQDAYRSYDPKTGRYKYTPSEIVHKYCSEHDTGPKDIDISSLYG